MSKIFTGISPDVKNKKYIKRGFCPVCYARTKMQLVQTSLAIRIYHIPTLKFRKQTVAVCTNCYSKLIPSKKALNSIKLHPDKLVWFDEFTVYNPCKSPLLDLSVNFYK